jgi:hypothetical protein
MIKWFAMLAAAVLIGGCTTNPSNLYWADRPMVLLPEPAPAPPPVMPPPPPPRPYTPPLPVLDPGPSPAYVRAAEPAVVEPAPEGTGPTVAAAAAAAKKNAGRHPHHHGRHGDYVAGNVVNPNVSAPVTAPGPAKPKGKARPKSSQI